MHWIKTGHSRYPFINLANVTNVDQHGPERLILWFGGNESVQLGEPEQVTAVLARLDALAKIDTHRTAVQMPAMNEEE